MGLHIRAGEHLLSPSVWAKSPEAASGKFEQMWPTVTLTKNGFSSLCCPKAKEIRSRSYKILDQRIPEPEFLMLADSNTDHCNGHFLLFLLSKDPAITSTMLPSHLQVHFHPKFEDRCWTSPPHLTADKSKFSVCTPETPGILRAALAAADFRYKGIIFPAWLNSVSLTAVYQ